MSVYKESWIEDLPHSRMTYPDTFLEKIRYWIWRLYTPFHPYIRDLSTALGIVHHEGRQDFLIGRLRDARTPRELVEYLVSRGYANHFVAWKDAGELVSLRKTNGFRYQYHVRIFEDREIRCHYEYTPEYRPVQHLTQTGFENRSEEFLELLRDWVLPAEPAFAEVQ
jgi:hypothetical protein